MVFVESLRRTCTFYKGYFNGKELFFLYIAHLLLLLCISVVCAVLFGYSVNCMSSVRNELYNAETTRLVSNCILALSFQAVYFGTSAASASESGELISLWDEILLRKRVKVDRTTVQSSLDTLLEYGPSPDISDQFVALRALKILFHVLYQLKSDLFSKEFSSAYGTLMGMQCRATELYEIYFQNAFLQASVFPLMGTKEYEMYEGFLGSVISQSNCSQYISFTPKINFFPVISNGPSLSGDPTFTIRYTASPLTKDALERALFGLTSEQIRVVNTSVEYWKKKANEILFFTIFSVIGMVLTAFFLVLSPVFFSLGTRSCHKAIQQHTLVGGKLKLLSLYTSGMVGLREDPRLRSLLENTFLVKLVGFIRRARPFFPHTAFGDIEMVVLTAGDNVLYGGKTEVVETTTAVTYDEDEEQASSELRGEIGLVAAVATIMCIHTRWHTDFNVNGELFLEALCKEKSSVIAAVERVVLAHRGGIHCITDFAIYVAFNLSSSCFTHELNALRTGLEIKALLEGRGVSLDISIASSLVVGGTVEEAGQRPVLICGPAMLFCQKTHILNRYHKTCIVMDKQVASKVFSLNIPGEDYCAVPISLFRQSPDHMEYQLVYGLLNSTLTEPLKTWGNIVKDFRTLMEERKYTEIQTLLEEFERNFLHMDKKSEAILHNSVEFWKSLIHSLEKGAPPEEDEEGFKLNM